MILRFAPRGRARWAGGGASPIASVDATPTDEDGRAVGAGPVDANACATCHTAKVYTKYVEQCAEDDAIDLDLYAVTETSADVFPAITLATE